ncbi:hypothetical protein P4I20_32330, partial [Paenibacillus graminis]
KYYADGMRFMKTNGNTKTQVNYNLNGEVISQEKIVSGVFMEQANFVREDRILVKKDKKASKYYSGEVYDAETGLYYLRARL